MVNISNEQDADVIAIVDGLVRITNKAASIEKEPVDIGHGIMLHSSEVPLIDVVGLLRLVLNKVFASIRSGCKNSFNSGIHWP